MMLYCKNTWNRSTTEERNAGFSLVELIISILTASVLALAISVFLSSGLRMYSRESAEEAVWMESQTASARLCRLLQKAEQLDYYSNDGENTALETSGRNKLLCLLETEENEKYWYVILWNSERSELLLTKLEAEYENGDEKKEPVRLSKGKLESIESEMLQTEKRDQYILARYIDNIKLEQTELSDRLYKLNISLSLRDYECNIEWKLNLRGIQNEE